MKNGLKPEEYPAHFEEVRFKISGKAAEPKAPKKEKAEEPAKEKKQKAPKREAKEDKRPDKGAKKK